MANKELKSIKFPGLVDIYTVNSMPDGASANQQLVTDSEGIVKWDEKPFYSVQYGEDITWDGDTAGREEVQLGDGALWKISDTIYSPDGIIGSTFTVMADGVPNDIVITDEMLVDISSVFPGTWAVKFDGLYVFGSGPALDFTGSSGGLYYLKVGTVYVSSASLIKYGLFIVVYQAGQCTLESIRFNAPSAGLYACYSSGNDAMTSGTYNFTYMVVRHMIQSPTTLKRYCLDVDDSGALIVAEVSE